MVLVQGKEERPPADERLDISGDLPGGNPWREAGDEFWQKLCFSTRPFKKRVRLSGCSFWPWHGICIS